MKAATPHASVLRLRPATADDVLLYFSWVNDPVVRAGSFRQEPVNLAMHRAWFSRALEDPSVQMYVLMADDAPVGQVRLTFSDVPDELRSAADATRAAYIAYSVAAEQRGKGYGRRLLELAEGVVPSGTLLVGEVKDENASSRRIFSSLGYAGRFSARRGCWVYWKTS